MQVKWKSIYLFIRDVVTNVLDCDNLMSEFDLPSRYYVPFFVLIPLGKV